jgi:DNA invertase Pin-like site-specific DNA recombinase
MNKKQPLVLSYLRFSHPSQALGDTVRRQLEKSDAWCQKKGWTIDDSIRDEGISAFRAKNAISGALSRLLKLIDLGRIPKGSYLLIENLDRLSRAEIIEAVELFLSIVRRGIVIVTLSDGFEYSKANMDFQNLMYSIMMLSRSNEESKRKSELVGAAWRKKRSHDAKEGKAITKKLPLWLKMVDGKIEADKERARLVKEIFKLSLKGWGRNRICKWLNKNHKPFGKTFWSSTYVLNILRGKAVIGEYEPHRLVYDANGNKRREADGDPIEGYYPRVIDDNTFYAAQKALNTRRRTGGPTEDVTFNLWQGMLKDMDGFAIISKTSTTWRRYYISSGRDGRGDQEKYMAFPADQFDFAVLFRLAQIEMQDTETDFSPIRQQLAEVEGRLGDIKIRLEQLTEVIATKPLQTLVAGIEKLETEKIALEKQRYDLLMESQRPARTIRELLEQWRADMTAVLRGDFQSDRRLILRETLRRQISGIQVLFQKDGARDYVASMVIVLTDWGKRLYRADDIDLAFRLDYIDYREKGYNKVNPYKISWLLETD